MYVYHYSATIKTAPFFSQTLMEGILQMIGILQRDAPVVTAEDYRQVRDDILDAHRESRNRESLIVHSLSLLHCDPERKEKKTATDDDGWKQKQSLRHLAACLYYLPACSHLPEAKSLWASVENNLHSGKDELSLIVAEELGAMCEASSDYWEELALAAECLGLSDRAARLRAHSHQTGGGNG